MSVTAFLALGSNLGDRTASLEDALRRLNATRGVTVTAVSQAYETEPWGVTDQPSFANAVAHIETDLAPAELLAACKRIEGEMGRQSGLRYGPRPIDIDVLLYGAERIDTPELTVPHPRLLERDFVVTPLLEVAPNATLPDGTHPSREAATEGRVCGVLGPLAIR
jgi:2-amino-4-hydroxy-6-hydroxymethyldihydropteridine diphosphokinase